MHMWTYLPISLNIKLDFFGLYVSNTLLEADDHRNQLDLHPHKHEEDYYVLVVDHMHLHKVPHIGEVVDLHMDHHDSLHVVGVDNHLVEDHERLEVGYRIGLYHNIHHEEVEFDVDNLLDDHHIHVEVDDGRSNLREEDHNPRHRRHDEVENEIFHDYVEELQLVPKCS